MGGNDADPTYQEVCSDKTGHVEVVQVTFDDEIVSYQDLLQLFWDHHDPTSWDAQRGDTGSQYRAVIFAHGEEQLALAEQSKADLVNSGKYDRPIVTLIRPAGQFFRAEEYHQHYYTKQD